MPIDVPQDGGLKNLFVFVLSSQDHRRVYVLPSGLDTATMAFTVLLFCLTLPSTSAEGRMDHPAECESALDKIGRLRANCSSRRMTDLPEDVKATTKVLWMNHNFLVSPDWSHLKRLTVLEVADFSHNSISTISLKAPSPMYHLDLSYNNLSALPSFQFLDKLTILKLNNNHLSFLADGAFSKLPNIIELHLKNNNIRLLYDAVFYNLPSLTHIHLRNNYLSSLPLSLLGDQTDLEVLDISNNLLRIIPPGFFSNVNIMYLYAFGNFWKCDCRALYFAEWISDWGSLYDEHTFPNDSSVVCWEPKIHQGKALGELTEDELCVKTPIPLMAARTTSSVSITTRISSEELQKGTPP